MHSGKQRHFWYISLSLHRYTASSFSVLAASRRVFVGFRGLLIKAAPPGWVTSVHSSVCPPADSEEPGEGRTNGHSTPSLAAIMTVSSAPRLTVRHYTKKTSGENPDT